MFLGSVQPLPTLNFHRRKSSDRSSVAFGTFTPLASTGAAWEA